MNHEHGSQEPRYSTVRDYLRVLRHYWWLIIGIAVLGGGIAVAQSARQDKEYQATASVAYHEETRDSGIFGLNQTPPQQPVQLAATKAATITGTRVLDRAERSLRRDDITHGDLEDQVESLVDPSSALVEIIVESKDPEQAAAIANAVARAAAAVSNEDTQRRFEQAARTAREELEARIDALPEATAAIYEAELARLESLSRFASSAEVAQPATVPTDPISPQPVRNAALGVIAGLLVGLIAAFLRDSMDRRLRSAHEIQSHFQLPILGHVRDTSMGQIPYIATGANGSKRDGEVDLEGFRILRRNLDFLDPGTSLRSIVVTSAFPEEGKTTVSTSLALVLAVAGKRTLLVECDLRRPQIANRLSLAPTPGLSDFLLGRATPKEILRAVEFNDVPEDVAATGANGGSPPGSAQRLACIPAGSPTPNAAELLGSTRFADFLAQVSEAYEAVVIDSSPLLPVADTLELLPQADGIIICARELKTTREQARATRAALEHLPERPAGLVVTGTRPREEDYAYGYTYSYGQR